MPNEIDTLTTIPAGPWADQSPFIEHDNSVFDETSATQNQWVEEQRPTAAPSRDETDTTHSSPAAASTDPTEPDSDEDFGPFQSASTDPFKRPIYAQHEIDETQTLLNTESDPETQIGIFGGAGLVVPLQARFDASTRSLRRAGKLALRRLQLARENEAGRQKEGKDEDQGVRTLSAVSEGQKEDVVDGSVARQNSTEASPCGVLSPVSFARLRFTEGQRAVIAEIDEMMEEEKMVWKGASAWGEMV